jgi:hypothetical protein
LGRTLFCSNIVAAFGSAWLFQSATSIVHKKV